MCNKTPHSCVTRHLIHVSHHAGKNMVHTLFEALRFGSRLLPDVDFVVSTGDHPLVPLDPLKQGARQDDPLQKDARQDVLPLQKDARQEKIPLPPIMSIATTSSHADLPWPCFSFWDWREAGELCMCLCLCLCGWVMCVCVRMVRVRMCIRASCVRLCRWAMYVSLSDSWEADLLCMRFSFSFEIVLVRVS